MRVAYPSDLLPELLQAISEDVELIPVSQTMDHEVEAEVWIPDPYPTRAIRTWPHLRGVRLVLSMMAGTEWIPDVVGPHVTICNAHGAHNVSTAEWVLAAIFAMLKQFPLYLDVQRSGIWKRRFDAVAAYSRATADSRLHHPPVMLEDLTGKTVLIVGYGAIGKEIERMLAPFRVEVLRVARTERENPKVNSAVSLSTLLPQADVVILILPYTEASHQLIGHEEIALMRHGALLVNAARGAIVSTDALIEALHANRIRAAIDVTDPEPLPEGHPLWNCPNLLITPHVAASSPHFASNALRVVTEELHRFIKGEPLKSVVQAAV